MTKTIFAAIAMLCATPLAAQDMTLPDLVKQPTPEAVVEEHLAALNVCDWNRLMAQYPDNAEVHLKDGVVVRGRKDIGELFAGFCKPESEGGLIGIKFTPESTFVVDGTVNAQWVATADFLAEPYKGSDAYVTQDGLMAAMVSTFDGAALKKK